MGNERHQTLNFNEHKHPNGYTKIASNFKIPLYPKIEQVPQSKTWILRQIDGQDFRRSRTGWKQKLTENCPNFPLTENSILELRETFPLEHSIFSCATGFLYTDNYFNDKRVFEYNLTKNVKSYLWISNQALNVNYPKIQYKNDTAHITPNKNAEECLVNLKFNKKKFDKPQEVRSNKTRENEGKRNKDISNKLNCFRNENTGAQESFNDDAERNGKIRVYGETNDPLIESDTQSLQNTVPPKKFCFSENNESSGVKVGKRISPDRHYENSVSIEEEYESLSKVSSTSIGTYSEDPKMSSNGRQNVQVFCMNCKNEPEFPMPVLLEKCCSDTYISAEEPSIGTSCECLTCPKSKDHVIQSKNQGIQTVKTKTRKELGNIPIISNNKDCFIERQKCNVENPRTRTRCSEAAKTSCTQYTTPPSLDTIGLCQNSMKKRTIQDDDMESFSTLSLFFIMKDLNTGRGSYCERQESCRLLSTAMICMRVKNTQSRKKPSKSKIMTANVRTRSCSDISGSDCTKTGISAKTNQNSQSPALLCSPERIGSDRKIRPVFIDPPQENGYKVLGIQTSEQEEKRYPRELNLLLSFHPDKRRNTQGKNCPDERARPLRYRSHLQRQLLRIDKTAQASITQRTACVQLSTTKTPTMHEKGNQFCPSRRSKSIQPSSTIFLRQTTATTFPRESRERSRICRSQFSTESSLFYSPPPCPLYLPDFEEASGQTLEAPPRTPFMVPMAVDLHEEESSTSLACIEMKKKFSSTLKQVKNCTINSKPNCKLSCGEEMLKNFEKIKAINPSKNNYLDLGSTRVINSQCLTSISFKSEDSHKPMKYNGATDSDEGLEILKLKQSSRLSKKPLFSSLGVKLAHEIECCDGRKKDIKFLGEDLQSLKRAIEKFMSIDITDMKR